MAMQIRDYTDADRSYVISTWLSNYWPHARAHLRSDVSRADYDRDMDGKIKAGLVAGMSILIAYDPRAPEVIAGWVAFGPGPVLHYVYVRRALWGNGVGAHLLRNAEADVCGPMLLATHVTPDLYRVMPLPSSKYDPTLFPPKAK